MVPLQANAVKFWNLKPSTATRVNRLANQFWLAGILFSITFGLLKVSRDICRTPRNKTH